MRVREIFHKFCSDSNNINQKEECRDLIHNFEFMMKLYVDKGMSAEQLCDQSGLCGATGARGLFLSAEKYEQNKKDA